jgi:P4 family phage/plasmid primase-like protien
MMSDSGNSDSGNSGPVQYLNPFREKAREYRNAGWRGTLPLPYKDKHAPPTGWHGHNAPYPTDEDVAEWCSDGKRHNIAIRLAGVDKDYEIVGIDVDHYVSGGKEKRGRDQLTALENRYGALPPTWISSARTDGRSGIRYFRVPRGLAFRGKIAKDIDCISKGNRYAAVWPSVHPNGETYWWFPPGTLPNVEGRNVWDGSRLPNAVELPELPEPWIDFLTRNRMKADAVDRIDMDTASDEIYAWSDDTFHGTDETPMCARMAEKIAKHKEDITSEPTSHDKITKAHWNIFRLAAEGHRGWVSALNEIEVFWANDVISRDKRDMDELKNEIWRSRTNALRKIKAQCDERVKIGAPAIDLPCDKTGECGSADSGSADSGPGGSGSGPWADVPRGGVSPMENYTMDDDGNGEHLKDQFSPGGLDTSFKWVEGYGWIVWHGGENPHWELDETGNHAMRQLWFQIKQNQLRYVDRLKGLYDTEIANATAAGLPTSGSGAAVPNSLVAARTEYCKWRDWAKKSGDNRQAIEAMRNTVRFPTVKLGINALDQNPFLLGVANGVVELDGENVRLRPARQTDYITLNTRTPYEQPSKFAQDKWEEYLETFLPDPDLRKTTQIALGHCLIGGNDEKIIIVLRGAPNTGKSTMINAIETALGDYATTVGQGLFRSEKFNEDLVDALNKRIAICSEFDDKDEMSASQVKRLSGGSDSVTSPIKNSMERKKGQPQFVCVLATNEVPTIRGADKALQNRLYVIPFNVVPKQVKKQYANVLKAVCGPAILNWLIEGYVEYRRIGELPMTKVISDETSAFVSELDEIAAFAASALKRHDRFESVMDWTNDSEWCVTRADMYSHFERWWTENNFQQNKIPSAISFTKRLRALGYPGSPGNDTVRVGTVATRWWYGVKLGQIKQTRSNVVSMPGWTKK